MGMCKLGLSQSISCLPASLKSKSEILAADLVGYTLAQNILLLAADEAASDLLCDFPEDPQPWGGEAKESSKRNTDFCNLCDTIHCTSHRRRQTRDVTRAAPACSLDLYHG